MVDLDFQGVSMARMLWMLKTLVTISQLFGRTLRETPRPDLPSWVLPCPDRVYGAVTTVKQEGLEIASDGGPFHRKHWR